MEDIAILKRKFSDKRAAEYRSRGYGVIQDAPLEFLPGFRADLLVSKDGENKVIAVQTRTSLAVTPEIDQVAEILGSKPGWSFDLLLVGEPERLDAPENVQPFDGEDILRRIDEADGAFAAGFAEAAFLLAWSACEAAVRAMVAAEGVDIQRVTHAGYVLGQAVFHGALSSDDDKYLSDMLRYRNAIVHGFEVTDFDAMRAKDLIIAARKLHRACAALRSPSERTSGTVDWLNPLDVPARLEEFRDMEDGWEGGKELAPNNAGLEWLSNRFVNHYPYDVPLPCTYPSYKGGIQMEWSIGTTAAVLEIDLETHNGEWFWFDINSNEETLLDLNLETDGGWATLVEHVRHALGTRG